jgi:hypothetical protein
VADTAPLEDAERVPRAETEGDLVVVEDGLDVVVEDRVDVLDRTALPVGVCDTFEDEDGERVPVDVGVMALLGEVLRVAVSVAI